MTSMPEGQPARLRCEEELLRCYIDHMHSRVMNLYVAMQPNPLRYLVDREKLAKYRGRLAKPGPPLDSQDVILLILYIARLPSLVRRLLGILGEAERYMLYRRVYKDIESWELRGPIDWRNTLINISRGQPPVQKISVHTLSSPENLLLKAVIELVQDKLSKALGTLNSIVSNAEASGSPAQDLQWLLDGLKHLRGILENYRVKLEVAVENSFLSLLPERLYYEWSLEYVWSLVEEVERTPWKPGWVERLLKVARNFLLSYNLERSFDSLVDYVAERLGKSQVKAEYFIKVYSWKLYEVYVLYLILKALKSLNARIERFKVRRFRVRYDRGTITVYYNVNLLKKREKAFKAIPDIALLNEKRIVIEVKFSRSPEYISESIFKVLGYMLLLDAHVGVLVYPSIKERAPLDKEERTIYRSVLKEIEREKQKQEEPYKLTVGREGLERIVYIARLEPLEKREESNEKIVKTIIEESKGGTAK